MVLPLAENLKKTKYSTRTLRFIEICSQLWREIETTAQHLGNLLPLMETWDFHEAFSYLMSIFNF